MIHDDQDDTIFRALSHRTRRQLLDALKAGPLTTGALCDQHPELDRCTVMQHLAVLTDANLVIIERRGRERWNYLNVIPIQQIHQRWIGAFAGYTADKLGHLEQSLAETGADAARQRIAEIIPG
ncbi:MAG: helix-turn-helix transcriptional regulator [Thermomicrobiales bacterium]|nr:helix-turn-helix transcriptional regulator [Thermomicrobiales bacterium]